MNDGIDDILSSEPSKTIQLEKSYKDVDNTLETDLKYINTKIASLEVHVGILDSMVDNLRLLSQQEKDPKTKTNMYIGISKNIQLIAEVSDTIQKFAMIKYRYRTEQSNLVHRQNIAALTEKADKASLSVSDLVQMFRGLSEGKKLPDDSSKKIEMYDEIEKDLDDETYKLE